MAVEKAGKLRPFREPIQNPCIQNPKSSDFEGKVAAAYGSYGLKKFMGKEFMGVYRHTFAIATDGRIEKIYLKVKPESHAAEIFADLERSP